MPSFANAQRTASENFMISSGDPGIQLYVRNKHAEGSTSFPAEKVVLFVHGATYPSETIFDIDLPGGSWADLAARKGYDVYMVDVRGYGGSDKPEAVEAYAIKDMCADVAGLVEALGERQAILIGHDWGAPIVWNTSLFFPHKVRAVAALSVPHTGRGAIPRIELFRQLYKDRFFYQLYFQQQGVAEAELEADVRTSLRKMYYWISGEGMKAGPRPKKPADAKLLDGMADPDPLPDWLKPEDLDYYVGEFERSGFRGPLNRYRTSEIDFAQQAEIATRRVEQPAAFIAGSLEPVLAFVPGIDLTALMREQVADLRLVRMIDGAGHWVQQERPAEVNAALLEFLQGLA